MPACSLVSLALLARFCSPLRAGADCRRKSANNCAPAPRFVCPCQKVYLPCTALRICTWSLISINGQKKGRQRSLILHIRNAFGSLWNKTQLFFLMFLNVLISGILDV